MTNDFVSYNGSDNQQPHFFFQERLISNISQKLTQNTALYSLNVDLNVSKDITRFLPLIVYYCRSLKLSMVVLILLSSMLLHLDQLLGNTV